MASRILKIYENGNYTDANLLIESTPHPYVQLLSPIFNSPKLESDKLYNCMQKLHEMLDAKNIKLLCNAFRYDVRPSNMALSMGQGIKAYELVLGKPATRLVNIFDATDRLDLIGTLEDQKKYHDAWLKSLLNE